MKRNDLQCVRGVAIISVLLFHFFPKKFPNGYVGVDQFFVLSGFLMMMIYGSRSVTLETTQQFYYRRIKRIVPLYALIIFIGIVAVYYLFEPPFWRVNVEAAEIALLFATNLGGKDASNKYFTELQEASDLYTHTWSLGAEMQFYLIAPVFFFILSILNNVWIRSLYLFLTMAASLAYHFIADPSTSFNSTFCRMWQFEVGIVAFSIGSYLTTINGSQRPNTRKCTSPDQVVLLTDEFEPNDHQEPVSTTSNCCFVFSYHGIAALCSGTLLILSFCPIAIEAEINRIVTTFSTGVLIAIGSQATTVIFNNRVLTYIGDISYSLYLIHWPVYCYAKNNLEDSTAVYVVAIILCVIVAVLITETFEKFYLTLDKRWIWTLITLLYTLTITFILVKENVATIEIESTNEQDIYDLKNAKSFFIEKVIQTNNMFDRDEYTNLIPKNCYPNATAFGYCKFENKNFGKLANLSMYIVGNSYASNTGAFVNKHFGPFANSIEKLCRPMCEALIEAPQCVKEFKEYSVAIADAKPDVLFIIARHAYMMIKPIKGKLEDDPYLKQAWSKLQEFESIVGKRIYILDAFPLVKNGYMKALNKLIQTGAPINSSTLIQDRDYLFVQQRTAELQKRCKKCVVFSYMPKFTDKNGEHMLVDPETKLTLYTSVSHLSPVGLKLVEPIFADLAKQFKADLEHDRF